LYRKIRKTQNDQLWPGQSIYKRIVY
jgi:hypothetical protein